MNKNVNPSLIYLIISIIFAALGAFVLLASLNTASTQDSSGLSTFTGQAGEAFSIIPFLLAIIFLFLWRHFDQKRN